MGRYHDSKTVAQLPPRAPESTVEPRKQQRAQLGPVFPPNLISQTPVPQLPNVPFPLAATYLLWGVTFCSILTAGNRRCPQPRKVRVASVPLTARSSITREVGLGGPLPLLSRQQPPQPGWHESSLLRCFRESSGSLARSASDGERENGGGLSRSGREKGETLQTLRRPPIPDTVVNTARC